MEDDTRKYKGYGYHGGGRKKLSPELKKQFNTISISGSPEEIAVLKQKAADSGISVSRFVLKTCLEVESGEKQL